MGNKNILIGLLVLFIVVAVFIFLFLKNRQSETDLGSRGGVNITQGAGETDTVEVRKSGDKSVIENTTNQYSVSVPNSWRVEVKPSSLKFSPSNDSGTINNCLLEIISFDSRGRALEEIIDENIFYAAGTRVRNAGEIVVQGHTGLLQEDYGGNRLESETIYLNRDGNVHAISSFYGSIHGSEEVAEYDICHPIFNDLASSFSFTD